jgi:hypothetical protein
VSGGFGVDIAILTPINLSNKKPSQACAHEGLIFFKSEEG